MTVERDDDGNAILKMSALWKIGAALAVALISAQTGLLFTWGVWITSTVQGHRTEIALLKQSRSNGVSQSVKVGGLTPSDEPELVDSHRGYLTTAEVAKREGKTERTVVEWIASGMIEPPPSKPGKEWQIAENYRITPKTAENCGDAEEGKP